MITKKFLCLFKQAPYLCASSKTAVQLSAVGTRAFFLQSHNKQNQQEKKFFFLGSFSSGLVHDRCVASVFEAIACDVLQSRCVCFISEEYSVVLLILVSFIVIAAQRL